MRRPLVLPEWSHTIAFERVVPERNCYRAYQVQLSQDLFGQWVVTRSWGRIGKPLHTHQESFAFRFDAKQLAEQIIRRRLQHGYRTISAR